MFRDGLLSPRSKLLPGGGTTTLSLYIEDDNELPANRANSVLSVASSSESSHHDVQWPISRVRKSLGNRLQHEPFRAITEKFPRTRCSSFRDGFLACE